MAYLWFFIVLILCIVILQKNDTIKKLKQRPEEPEPEQTKKTVDTSTAESDYDWAEIGAKKFSKEYLQPISDKEKEGHFFYAKKVVITGNFDMFPYREEMAKLLWEVGADVNSTVSRKTHYVIVGENAGWRKLEQIEQHGITKITEEEFIKHFPDYKSPYL